MAIVERLNSVGEAVTCRHCGGGMKPGKAIAQTWGGTPEWPGDPIYTMSFEGPGRLIDCLKCEKCGYSISVGTNS